MLNLIFENLATILIGSIVFAVVTAAVVKLIKDNETIKAPAADVSIAQARESATENDAANSEWEAGGPFAILVLTLTCARAAEALIKVRYDLLIYFSKGIIPNFLIY